MNKLRLFTVVLVWLLCFFNTIAQGQIIRFVKLDDGRALKNGLSWSTAYDQTQLQTAINSLIDTGGQVWVAQGTYKPTTNPTDRFACFSMKNQIAIYGGFSADGTSTLLNRGPTRFPTILSGDIDGDSTLNNNSYSIIRNQYYTSSGFNYDVDSTAILDGFIVTGANGNGAIVNDNANPTIINCVITGNVGGGGVLNSGAHQARFINCLIAGNTGAWGGGMSNYVSNPRLINCIIRDNVATNRGGGISNSTGSFPILTNCTFVGNLAPAKGGGAISNYDGCLPKLANCILWNNGGQDAIVDQPGDYTKGNYHGTYGVQAANCLIEAEETTPTGSNNKKALVSPFVSLTFLQLTASSEAIDAGSNETYRLVDGPLIDFKGNSRILNGIIDLGAIEYASLSIEHPLKLVENPVHSGSSVRLLLGDYPPNRLELYRLTGESIDTQPFASPDGSLWLRGSEYLNPGFYLITTTDGVNRWSTRVLIN